MSCSVAASWASRERSWLRCISSRTAPSRAAPPQRSDARALRGFGLHLASPRATSVATRLDPGVAGTPGTVGIPRPARQRLDGTHLGVPAVAVGIDSRSKESHVMAEARAFTLIVVEALRCFERA